MVWSKDPMNMAHMSPAKASTGEFFDMDFPSTVIAYFTFVA